MQKTLKALACLLLIACGTEEADNSKVMAISDKVEQVEEQSVPETEETEQIISEANQLNEDYNSSETEEEKKSIICKTISFVKKHKVLLGTTAISGVVGVTAWLIHNYLKNEEELIQNIGNQLSELEKKKPENTLDGQSFYEIKQLAAGEDKEPEKSKAIKEDNSKKHKRVERTDLHVRHKARIGGKPKAKKESQKKKNN